MPRKRTQTKRQKPRKVAAAHQRWPHEYDDVDHLWAKDAIIHGNGAILARYLRETNEIDPRVRRELAKVLDPTSNEFWRLHAQYRSRGKPTKAAKVQKNSFNSVLGPLVKLLSGTSPIETRCHRTLAEMLDPESHHALWLEFKQRKSGRPPLAPKSKDRPHYVPAPIEDDHATLIARQALSVRSARKTGPKVPLKQLHDGTSAATLNRRLQRLRKAK